MKILFVRLILLKTLRPWPSQLGTISKHVNISGTGDSEDICNDQDNVHASKTTKVLIH